MMHPCNRQTERQTDGLAIAYSALSIMLYAVAAKTRLDVGYCRIVMSRDFFSSSQITGMQNLEL